jgi:hypothetical protein
MRAAHVQVASFQPLHHLKYIADVIAVVYLRGSRSIRVAVSSHDRFEGDRVHRVVDSWTKFREISLTSGDAFLKASFQGAGVSHLLDVGLNQAGTATTSDSFFLPPRAKVTIIRVGTIIIKTRG